MLSGIARLFMSSEGIKKIINERRTFNIQRPILNERERERESLSVTFLHSMFDVERSMLDVQKTWINLEQSGLY